jgi:hypothetical protein
MIITRDQTKNSGDRVIDAAFELAAERDALLWNAKVGQNIPIYFEAAVSMILPLALIHRKAIDNDHIDRARSIVIRDYPEQSFVVLFFGRRSAVDKMSVRERRH